MGFDNIRFVKKLKAGDIIKLKENAGIIAADFGVVLEPKKCIKALVDNGKQTDWINAIYRNGDCKKSIFFWAEIGDLDNVCEGLFFYGTLDNWRKASNLEIANKLTEAL